jgi:hypothetical protein
MLIVVRFFNVNTKDLLRYAIKYEKTISLLCKKCLSMIQRTKNNCNLTLQLCM